MARQRFIHPEIWKDPVFGRLTAEEKVFFIACFSLADDEGRLLADANSLRGEMYRFSNHSLSRITKIRDSVVAKVESVHLYVAQGQEYIALLRWSEYQKPKYPTPSKIPPPFLQDSSRIPPGLEEDSPMGRDGLGRDEMGRGWNAETAAAVEKLLKGLKIKDLAERAETELFVRGIAGSFKQPAPFLTALDDIQEQREKRTLDHEGKYAVRILTRMRDEGQYAA